MDDSDDKGDVESRCSAACTRAGLTALIFATFGFTLLPIQTRLALGEQFGAYAFQRWRLVQAIDNIEYDQCWKKIKDGDEDPEVWTISRLAAYRCTFPLTPLVNPVPQKTQSQVKEVPRTLDGRPLVPAIGQAIARPVESTVPSPTNVRIVAPFRSAQEMADALKQLSDEHLLTEASHFSNRAQFSIYSWGLLRGHLAKPTSVAFTGSPAERTEAISKHFADSLTLADLRRLARAEYVPPDTFDRLGEEFQVGIPGLQNRLGVDTAIAIVEAVILLSLVWFWLFEREALATPGFPGVGTLFGAFGRTQLSQLIYYVLVAIPALAAGVLASKTWSANPSNIALAGGSIVTTLMILRLSNFYGGVSVRARNQNKRRRS